MKMKKKPYLYLISSTSGHSKIGYSSDPLRRLKELQKTQGPFVYELEYLWEYESEEQAKYIEGRIHQMYSDYRVNGEWFTLGIRELIELGSLQPHGLVSSSQ